MKARQTWRILAASVTGSAHLKQGQANEDAFAAASCQKGNLVIAVSDGAGSARYAAEASLLAVQTAVEVLTCDGEISKNISPARLQASLLEVLCQARLVLQETACDYGAALRDFACTLLMVVITDSLVGAAQLGDGAIIVLREDGFAMMTQAFHGSFATETVFLSSADFLEHASLALMPSSDVKGLALMTDGLEPVAIDLKTSRPFEPFFSPVFSFARSEKSIAEQCAALETFLGSQRLAERSHDDKTLVLLIHDLAQTF